MARRQIDRATASPARGIPSLDGLRAISVGIVLLGHAIAVRQVVAWREAFPGAEPIYAALEEIGTFGVRVFFVLSGYLITSILIKERERTGRIRLGRFYFRRTLRIFPPFYAYLAALAIALSAGWIFRSDEPGFRWWPAVLYVSNIFQTHWGPLKHTWSLSVEEQFYLVWPLTVLVLGRSKAWRSAVFVLVTAPLVRMLAFRLTGSPHVSGVYTFDGLAAGAVLAFTDPVWRTSERWGRWLAHTFARSGAVLALVGALVIRASTTFATNDLIDQFAWQSVDALAMAFLVMSCVRFPDVGIARLLNTRVLRAIGIASYSIYLVQQPFLLTAGPVDTLAAALTAIGVAATASYFLVERPSLALRGWIERSWLERREGGDSTQLAS